MVSVVQDDDGNAAIKREDKYETTSCASDSSNDKNEEEEEETTTSSNMMSNIKLLNKQTNRKLNARQRAKRQTKQSKKGKQKTKDTIIAVVVDEENGKLETNLVLTKQPVNNTTKESSAVVVVEDDTKINHPNKDETEQVLKPRKKKQNQTKVKLSNNVKNLSKEELEQNYEHWLPSVLMTNNKIKNNTKEQIRGSRSNATKKNNKEIEGKKKIIQTNESNKNKKQKKNQQSASADKPKGGKKEKKNGQAASINQPASKVTDVNQKKVNGKKKETLKVNNGKSFKTLPQTKTTTTNRSGSNTLGGDVIFESHISEQEALRKYAENKLIRGRLRVVPGKQSTTSSFVSCDRGSLDRDILIQTDIHRNRAMDGDIVYVELLEDQPEVKNETKNNTHHSVKSKKQKPIKDETDNNNDNGGTNNNGNGDDADDNSDLETLQSVDGEHARETTTTRIVKHNVNNDEDDDKDNNDDDDDDIEHTGDKEEEEEEEEENESHPLESWRDDDVQRRLWDPAHNTKKPRKLKQGTSKFATNNDSATERTVGKVVHVVCSPSSNGRRRIIGRLMMTNGGGCALAPTNKSLPLFYIPNHEIDALIEEASTAASASKATAVSGGTTSAETVPSKIEEHDKEPDGNTGKESNNNEDEEKSNKDQNSVDEKDNTSEMLKTSDVEENHKQGSENGEQTDNDESSPTEESAAAVDSEEEKERKKRERKRLKKEAKAAKAREKAAAAGSKMTKRELVEEQTSLYQAYYRYGSWKDNARMPACCDIQCILGGYESFHPEYETQALLMEHGLDHGEFTKEVLRDVENAVKAGRQTSTTTKKKKKKKNTVNDGGEDKKENDEESTSTSAVTTTGTKVGLDGAIDLGWSPTAQDLKGRRDFRHTHRIFTIDPTTAKDLDDAVHIKPLPNGRVEIGVHIADVSHFVKPDTHVDQEAKRRATTVYLVDRTVPMLPRPLCEIACSLNENVDRLAFSCVWTMNRDGTLATKTSSSSKKKKSKQKKGKQQTSTDGKTNNSLTATSSGGGTSFVVNGTEVWYGRSVIRSCARLDYNTAQNIIEGKIAVPLKASKEDSLETTTTTATSQEMPNTNNDEEELLWPKARRPLVGGKHTMEDVANDVRLLHEVAKARRALRFEHGALALHAVKLAFSFASNDTTNPELCGAYPIKDSNRLIEEYMLLANYLVAQRLITHAGDRALLRQHPPPLEDGLADVVLAASHFGYEIDVTSSQSLQESLNKLERCHDINDNNQNHSNTNNRRRNNHNSRATSDFDSNSLAIQCITHMMTTPMKPAEYIAAGEIPEDEWRHFALNIPYYTHFTSPIRRYADVMVHRLLQATLEDDAYLNENNNKKKHTNNQRRGGGGDGIPRTKGGRGGGGGIKNFPQTSNEIHCVASHCNDKNMASKRAQQQSDVIFLALYVRRHPIMKALGIITSMGEKSTFTVFVPDLGLSRLVYLDDHSNAFSYTLNKEKYEIILSKKKSAAPSEGGNDDAATSLYATNWPDDKEVTLNLFSKLYVACICSPRPPIDVKFLLVSPYDNDSSS